MSTNEYVQCSVVEGNALSKIDAIYNAISSNQPDTDPGAERSEVKSVPDATFDCILRCIPHGARG
jgi:hypothetical protein